MKHNFTQKMIGLAVCLAATTMSYAQTATVYLDKESQEIKGFGGINHPSWTGYDITEEETKKLYGTGDGELGLSVLRIWIDENSNNWGKEVKVAKRIQNEYGGLIFATPWNPPASMCYKVNGDNRQKYLSENSYQAYTDHLISFNNYMKGQGIKLYGMSFANEPDYGFDWTNWTVDQVYNYTKNYAGKLRVNGTKVISAESFAYAKKYYDKILNDASALANIDIIGTHYYASDAKTSDSFFQYPLADQKAPTKERWMTEHYTSSDNTPDGQPIRANLWPEALDVAYEVHRAMVESKMNAYVWWYLKRDYSFIGQNRGTNGQITKRGYIMGQFSKFIRPGYVRVEADKNPTYNVYLSAYKGDGKVVVVAVNRSTEQKTITVSIPNCTAASYKQYCTDQTRNMAKMSDVSASNGSFKVTLLPQSCTSFIGDDASSSKGKVILTSDSEAYLEGTTISLKAEPSVEVSHIAFLAGKDTIVDKWVAPYEWTKWTPAPGNYEVVAHAYNANGDLIQSAPLNIKVVKKPVPFGGNAATIPGKIEAENFDEGASGFAYYDRGEEYKGDVRYREEDIDIYKNGSGYAVGYCQSGEWMKYTVEVEKEGDYDVTASIACSNTTGEISVTFDGDKSSTLIFKSPVTADWDTYADVKGGKKIHLTPGSHEILLEITSDWINIDYLSFERDITGVDAVEAETEVNGECLVIDAMGRVISTMEVESAADAALKIKANNAPAGVYMLVPVKGGKSQSILVK